MMMRSVTERASQHRHAHAAVLTIDKVKVDGGLLVDESGLVARHDLSDIVERPAGRVSRGEGSGAAGVDVDVAHIVERVTGQQSGVERKEKREVGGWWCFCEMSETMG
jgi:hypothetical protein